MAEPVISSNTPILSVKNISKTFGAVVALKDVSFDLYPGEVLGLLGDNGAGKSTLVKIISGVYTPTSGSIFWNGREVAITNPEVARQLGIETIYQDLALADNLSVAANIYLGREKIKPPNLGRLSFLDNRKMEENARLALEKLKIRIKSPAELVGGLSGGQKQSVAIARAIIWGAKLVIMDEPTAALGVPERLSVLELVKSLKQQGISVIIISHNLQDVFAVTDRMVVLQRGNKAGELITAQATEAETVQMIVGGKHQ